MSHCPICSLPSDTVLTRELRRGIGTVYYCEACELGFLVAQPRNLKEYYAGEYREHVSHRATQAPTNPQELFDTYSPYQQARVDLVSSRIPASRSILEIGASAGQFISRFTDYALCCAIELDKACCRFMEHKRVRTSSLMLNESRFWYANFGAVCAFQVLEHTDDPVKFLSEVKHVMAPGAQAFIEVPNLREPLLSVWDIPEYVPFYFHEDHLFYFTEKSLRNVAERAGFDPAKMEVIFTQDYTLLSHLHWLMNKGPQDTCHPGMGPIAFKGKDSGMAAWLTGKMKWLNAEYVSMLEQTGQTANIMLVLTN